MPVIFQRFQTKEGRRHSMHAALGKRSQRLGGDALEIGGSMAGLLAARVLADFYDHVTIFERDALPATAEPRKGVPQGRHAHALLGGGRMALEGLFPGLTQRLLDAGAPQGTGRFFSRGGFFCRIPNAPKGIFVSRPLLEHEVRARVLALPNVYIVVRCDVLGLAASADQSRVVGLRVRRRPAGAAEELVTADLVVDAGGRGSRTPDWLVEMGYAAPEIERVEVGMGYSTRYYHREPGHLGGDLMVNIAPTPENRRASGMLAQEGDRWIVTLAGYFGDHPPTDEQGFLEFARRLPAPDVYELIRTATPLSDPVPFRFPANRRRRYDQLARFPTGLLVIGDAIASFTPIYGQGMTVAAKEALELHECLRQGAQDLARRFFKRANRAVEVAWSIAVGNDRSLSGARAASRLARLLNWYVGKVQVAARGDPQAALAFMLVANLIAAPPSLLSPRIVLRVLRANLQAAKSRTGAATRALYGPSAPPPAGRDSSAR
jgi:2-polyprenyl-6-methoxyphenol hydroxylase-like FAD-dependent oxidoreductase